MSSQGSPEEAHGRYLAALSLTALGIVFGDIGTSPIYALRESFHSVNGIDPTQANVLGVLSLILWSLIIVISIKYLTFVMRADNNGEGGIIALTALVAPPSQAAAKRRIALVMAGLFGAAVVAAKRWQWSPTSIVLFLSTLILVDLAFWGANLPKIPQGGWFPIVVAAVIFAIMTTWKRGRELVATRLEVGSLPLELLVADIRESNPARVAGTAVFMHKDPHGTPPALLHNLKHNRVLHRRVVLLSVVTLDVPHVADDDRLSVMKVAEDLYRVVASYGFAESPDVPSILEECGEGGLAFDMMQTTFFLSSETFVTHQKGGMARWRQRLFGRMSRNSLQPTAYFGISPNRVVELGMQVQL